VTTLFEIIRSAGKGEIVRTLAAEAGLDDSQAEEALCALLPEIGRAVRRTGESRSGAAAAHAVMRDERYQRYLDDPPALRQPDAASDGERVLSDILEDDEERGRLVRRVAAAIEPHEDAVRTLLPLVAVLAMGALGRQLREPSPGIPWFGTREGDHFDAPLLEALTALFEHDDERAKPR
jgi:hypothetical protein